MGWGLLCVFAGQCSPSSVSFCFCLGQQREPGKTGTTWSPGWRRTGLVSEWGRGSRSVQSNHSLFRKSQKLNSGDIFLYFQASLLNTQGFWAEITEWRWWEEQKWWFHSYVQSRGPSVVSFVCSGTSRTSWDSRLSRPAWWRSARTKGESLMMMEKQGGRNTEEKHQKTSLVENP